jgi:ATP-dependent DNA helicase MPH1
VSAWTTRAALKQRRAESISPPINTYTTQQHSLVRVAMDSDSDFGDLDDTAFLEAEAATQFDPVPAVSFQASPRTTKRRKIGHQDEGPVVIPPRQYAHTKRRGPFQSDSDEVDDSASSPEVTRSTTNSISSKGRQRKSTSRGRGDGESENDSKRKAKKTVKKKEDQIYVPTRDQDMTDVFYTQPPREHSPPWKTRGPIWQKPAVNIGVHRPSEPSSPTKWTRFDATKTMALPNRQSISSRHSLERSKSPSRPLMQPNIDESPKFPTATGPAQHYDPAQELVDLPSDAFASSSSSPQKPDSEVLIVSERRTKIAAPQTGLRQTTLFGRHTVGGEVPPSQANKRYSYVAAQKEELPTHHKLDPEAIKTWVYPTNLGKLRDYQFNIVARGLYHNLLVALPTGLGKTFIAATIMLNWFRWTTEAQIVFVAPTKPLVSQQVEACFRIAGIPRSQTTMLVGGVSPGQRAEEWASKRVFFMTPQTLINDLKSGIVDPKKIVLLVVDEAHKGTGGYAYVEVVSFLHRFNSSYRILALTATPGGDVESVQKVIDGLKISRIEIRTENSLDIREYVHKRQVDQRVFENSDEIEMCMELYSQALQPLVNKVAGQGAFWSSNPLDLTPYGCTMAQKKWAAGLGKNTSFPVKSMINTVFQILASLSQGMELLKYHGIGPFYMKMKAFKEAQPETKSRYKKDVVENESFKKLMIRLQAWVADDTFVGHPKLEYLQQVLLDHFVGAAEGNNANDAPPSETRIMVFAHFRDSAEEIVRVLKRHDPMIRPHVFVGQSSAKNSEGMSQKEQQAVIEDFKMGKFNTLVATSIGEEGLDIGEVDLIVCYDSKASPIRMLQRMGRTGRKRKGRIVLLQMKGKEVNDAEKAKDSYEKMQELIANGSSFAFHEGSSRRILPHNVQPTVDMRVVEIPLENSQSDFLPAPKKNGRAPKRPPKKFNMPDGVITGFVTAGRMDEEIKPTVRRKKTAALVYPSEEPSPLPPLEDVLLDQYSTKDLEIRFQTVHDDANDVPMIGALNLGGDIARQYKLSRTKYLPRPGRVTQGFVKMLQRMHAVDIQRLDDFKHNVHHSDFETEPDDSIVVSNDYGGGQAVGDDIWASDDPASQSIPQVRAKPGPNSKIKAAPKARAPPKPKPRPKPGPKPGAEEVSKPPTKRGRPPKPDSAAITPARQPKSNAKARTPKTPRYRVSDLVDEGAESSPPPTDPRMRLASQAIELGPDDTEGEDEINDTQAYRLDSDLRDFIAEDDEDVNAPDSSLPNLDFGDLGKGTQAVVKGARSKRPRRIEKLFTSDPTDDDAIMTSDSDNEVPLRTEKASTKAFHVVDSAEDEDDEVIVQPRKRARRVIDDDEDDE